MDNLVLAERAHFFSTSKYIFMKEKISILETRERFRLSLRKEKLDDYFQMKRIETFNFSRKSELEVVMKEICEKLEEASDLSSTATMLIESSNLNVIKSTVYYLRRKFSYQKFLNEFKSKQKFHLNSEIICQLLNCLEKYEDEKEILLNSICCLINISFTDNDVFKEIITTSKTLGIFEHFLSKDNELEESKDIMYHIIWLLSNIIKMDSRNLFHIFNSNIIEKITTLLIKNTILESRLSEIGVFFLVNVVNQSKSINMSLNIAKTCCEIFLYYTNSESCEIYYKCLKGLYSLTENYDENTLLNMIANHSLISKIFNTQYEKKDKKDLVLVCLKLIGNILRGNEEITNIMIRKKVIGFLKNLMGSTNIYVKMELCYALSQITSGTVDHNYELLKYDILSKIKDICYDVNTLVRKEALYIFSNACSKMDMRLTLQLIKSGIIEIFNDNLTNLYEREIIYISLKGLDMILSVGTLIPSNPFAKLLSDLGGVDAIENILSKIEVENISSLCYKILDTFYINNEIKGNGYSQYIAKNYMKIH